MCGQCSVLRQVPGSRRRSTGRPCDQVLGDDFIHIFELHKAVPDRLGIDHDDRAMLALVEAAGLVGADQMLQTGIFDSVLEGRFQLFAALGKTAWAGRGLVALVGADKEVMLEIPALVSFPSLPLCSAGCAARVAF